MRPKPHLVIIKSSNAPTPSSRLRRWRDAFLRDKKLAVTKSTLAKYEITINLYIDHVGPYHWPPTRFDLSDFLYATQQRASNATAFAYWSVLRNWMNYIHTAGGLDEYPNPAEQITRLKLSPSEPKPEPRGLSDAHLKTLFEHLNSLPPTPVNVRDRVMLKFIWRTGARSGEAGRLKFRQIHWDEQCARLPASETKNRRGRTLYFGKTVLTELNNWSAYLKRAGYTGVWVFPTIGHRGSTIPKNAPLTVSGTRRMFQRRCAQAGIPNYTVHELRHTFTKNAINAKKPLDAIRRQLGHSSPTMVLRYATIFDDEQARAFRDFGDEEE